MQGGPLAGIRVLEVESEHTSFAGLLLGWAGAEVLLVEPPGGSPSRRHGPCTADLGGTRVSLWWEFFNQGKRSVALDLDTEPSAFAALSEQADIVLEGEPPGLMTARGCDWKDVSSHHAGLIWIAITPFGRTTTRAHDPASDLTLMAGGGPMWNCGYDDHSLPPLRGGEGFAAQIGGYAAVNGAMVALLARSRSGRGQFIDVSLHAALNVTTEQATYEWLVRGATVQRQTGRHASADVTQRTQVRTRDGRYVNTGMPPGDASACRVLLAWLDDCGLRDEFADSVILELGSTGVLDPAEEAERLELVYAQRACSMFLAEHLDAYEFFLQAQRRGLAAGVINDVEDVLADPHFEARHAFVSRHDERLGRTVMSPGPPVRFDGVEWAPVAAPAVGEHSGWSGTLR